jgi:glycogen debranching enzyme
MQYDYAGDEPHATKIGIDQDTELDTELDTDLDQECAGDPYVLRGSASVTVGKITLKHDDGFLVADERGDLPDSEQETGLFWQGTRFLRACDLFLEGKPLATLSHSISDEEGTCQIDLANPFLRIGNEGIYQGSIHVRRLLKLHENQLSETLILTSFHPTTLRVRIGLKLSADFRDIFEVRGLSRPERGDILPTRVENNVMILGYRGLDNIVRETICTMTPPPARSVMQGQFWDFELKPCEPVELRILCELHIAATEQEQEAHSGYVAAPRGMVIPAEQAMSWERPVKEDDTPAGYWREGLPLPVVRSDNVFFNRMLTRGMHDLVMMCTLMPEGPFPYGGVPWYACPFGRDALITSLEFLPWFPEVARGTLGFLAAHQGTTINAFTEEEPGRILHEYRTGEMANCREIPFIPYYGTVDATPLFLVVLGKYIRWTNDLDFLREHWEHAEAAARWMVDFGDRDGDGFLEYARVADTGLVNQGWKDSWDAVAHADGSLAPHPIALCEVQGYAYAAYKEISYLAERLGKPQEAEHWDWKAEQLRWSFRERFWWEDEHVFYLALDGQKRPCKVVSSNAGQCLWTGIVPPEWATLVVSRLMADDMYTGWGIRTLAATSYRYNPMSYHNGSVWPHDTALIGSGFAHHGRADEGGRLLGNLFGVSLYYAGSRLPELFCGFDRVGGYGPTRYPVACSPQSWAAGAPFLLLSSLLGFQPEAQYQRLTLSAPALPEWMHTLELGHLRLGAQDLHLSFERSERGTSVILADATEIEVHVVPRP